MATSPTWDDTVEEASAPVWDDTEPPPSAAEALQPRFDLTSADISKQLAPAAADLQARQAGYMQPGTELTTAIASDVLPIAERGAELAMKPLVKVSDYIGVTPQTVADAGDVLKGAGKAFGAAMSGGDPTQAYLETAGQRQRAPTTGENIASGVQSAVAESLDFFTSPIGIATLGMGAIPATAQKAVTAAFVADMASSAPEQFHQFNEARKSGDAAGMAKGLTAMGLTGAFIGQGVKHLAKGTARALEPTERAGIADTVATPERAIPVPERIVEEAGPPLEREQIAPTRETTPAAPVAPVAPEPVVPAVETARTSPMAPGITRLVEIQPTDLVNEIQSTHKATGVSMTRQSYDLARKLTADDLPALEKAEQAAAEQNRAAMKESPPNFDAAMPAATKKQFLNEIIRFRKVQDMVNERGITDAAELEAFGKQNGVGELSPAEVRQPAPDPVQAKEAWKITAQEYAQGREGVENNKAIVQMGSKWTGVKDFPQHDNAKIHRQAVEQAVREGKPVPPEVLADYPGLQSPAPPQRIDPLTLTEPARPAGDWLDQAADAARERLKANRGKTTFGSGPLHELPNIRDYTIIAAKHIKDGVRNVAELAAKLTAEFGEWIGEHAQKIWDEAHKTTPEQFKQVETGRTEMRQLSERGTQAESIPEPVQERIAGAPESFYQTQSVKKVTELVRGMADAELGQVTEASNIFTAAKLEQANRLFEAGNNDAGYAIFSDLSTRLTRMGQVINQAKLLQGLNPDNIVKVVNADLKKSGRDPLTPKQAGELQTVSKTRIEAQRALDKATDQWLKDPADANAKLAEQALDGSNAAALNEQRAMHRFQHRTMAGLLKSILQGNLLTPISEVANIVGNISFSPFRALDRTIAAQIDAIDATLRNRPREIAVRPAVGTAEMVKGLIRGLRDVPQVLIKGSGDVIKGESRTGLHPLQAWVKMFARNQDMPTVGGKVPFRDRLNLAIEGTFGVPAEAMLRGLGAGDLPFRNAARARLIAEAARLKKVPAKDMRMAQKFPELFFDETTMKRLDAETAQSLFQRESETLQHLTSLLGKKGGWFDLAVAFVAPYKLTPWNLVGEILSYNPLIALGKTGLEARRGNIRQAELAAGKFVVGGMLTGAGWWLYQNGLLSPSLDSRDEAQKARILSGEVIPPNHINLTGLKRKLAGGNPAFQSGDETVDIFRGGGLAGSMFYMTANIGRDLERKPKEDGSLALALLRDSVLEQARYGVNQSFLKGIAGMLQSVSSGQTDNFIQAFANSIISIPIPNSLSTLSRAQREYKVDINAGRLDKEIANVVKTRLGFAGLDDYLPLKRGLWGEPLLETPRDKNALFYHFFDISKGRQVTDDAVPLELYRLWRKTGDSKTIPSLPAKSITVARETYQLDATQRSRYAELVGSNRRLIAEKIVVNPEFQKLPDELKINLLNRVYDKGQEIGKALYWVEAGSTLEKKTGRAGFNQ